MQLSPNPIMLQMKLILISIGLLVLEIFMFEGLYGLTEGPTDGHTDAGSSPIL